MYYVNNSFYDLSRLHPRTGVAITQNLPLNGFEAAVATAWKTVLDSTPPGKRVIFRAPHIKPMTGHQGGSYPRTVYMNDGTGTIPIVWCNNAIPIPGGGFTFSPAKIKYEKSNFELDPQKDIEAILWHMCFSALRNQTTTITDGKKYIEKPKLYVYNSEVEAEKFLENEGRSGAAIFYLTQSQQHIGDDNFINAMATLYDIHQPEKMSSPEKRMKILQAVQNADNKGDIERNSQYFISCVQDYEKGNALQKMVITVSKAVDRRIIFFDKATFKVHLGASAEQSLATWTTIPPAEAPKWKLACAKYLMNQPEKVEILEASIEEKVIEPKKQREIIFPKVLTPEFFRSKENGGMEFQDMRYLVKFLPGMTEETIKGMNRPEMAKILWGYFGEEKKTLDFIKIL
jgi:hypothetical protein